MTFQIISVVYVHQQKKHDSSSRLGKGLCPMNIFGILIQIVWLDAIEWKWSFTVENIFKAKRNYRWKKIVILYSM